VVALEFISLGNPVRTVLRHCGLPKSTFYYKSTGGKQGRKPYAVIFDKNGNLTSESIVLEEIKRLFEHPFVDYGCFKTYIFLKNTKQFKVSKHMVYQIMKSNQLLRNRHLVSSKKQKRNWVRDLLPKTTGAFTYFEFDIKYFWVSGRRRNAQVLTIIDIETRIVMGQYIAYSIEKKHVIDLFAKVISLFGMPTDFTVRSDNGSQFTATETQEYLIGRGINQEFTKPATPQQDAHVEAYHSIIERAVCERYSFENINDLKKTLESFQEFYNFERIHSGTAYTSPYLNFLQKEKELNSSPLLKTSLDFLAQSYSNYINNSVQGLAD
jgi:hypothetical protein